MSSLAAARADNYYVPNNEPFNKNKKLLLLKKKKRKRSIDDDKNNDEGITIRFAMPYPGTCLNCGDFFAEGTRFYVTKSECGKYLDKIPIFRFSKFHCNNCNFPFVIETDPKNSSYIYKSGCKARGGSIPNVLLKNIESDNDDEEICRSKDGQFVYTMNKKKKKKKKRNSDDDDDDFDDNTSIIDPLAELEMIKKDQERDQRIKDIYQYNKKTQYEDYNMNAKLRKNNRKKRKKEKKLERKAVLLGLGDSSVLKLLPYHTNDMKQAKEMYNNNNNNNNATGSTERKKKKVVKISRRKMRKRLLKDSIF